MKDRMIGFPGTDVEAEGCPADANQILIAEKQLVPGMAQIAMTRSSCMAGRMHHAIPALPASTHA